MADSIFLLLDATKVPTPTAIATELQILIEGSSIDSDWVWGTHEGWLPGTYRGLDSGFELLSDRITEVENPEFIVSERPELDMVVELTPRGGLHSLALANAFAAVVARASGGIVEIDEETQISSQEIDKWIRGNIDEIEIALAREKERKEVLQRAREDGLSDRNLLEIALQSLIGQKVVFRGGSLMFRTEDNSMIHGSRCTIRKGSNVLIEHGHYAKIRDMQSQLLRQYMPEPTEEQVQEIDSLSTGLSQAERDDEAALEKAYEVMGGWLEKVSVTKTELGPDNSIEIKMSDGHTISYMTEDNSSMLSVTAGGLDIILNGQKMTVRSD